MYVYLVYFYLHVNYIQFHTVGVTTTGKLISGTNSKHLAHHFGSDVVLVAIMFFWLQFFSEMAADGQDLLACKILDF